MLLVISVNLVLHLNLVLYVKCVCVCEFFYLIIDCVFCAVFTMASKRIRQDVSLAQKYKVIQLLEQKVSQSEIACRLSMSQLSVSVITKKRSQINEDFESCANPFRKRQRTGNSATVDCLNGSRPRDIPLNGPILMEKALVTANMSGSDKRQLLVIGKSKDPRCFHGKKSLPVKYESNKNSWMTSEIFKTWIKEFNKEMCKEKRKVILLVDNCSAHLKKAAQ